MPEYTILWTYTILTSLARDAEERENWIGALENTVMKHSHSGLRVCLSELIKWVYWVLNVLDATQLGKIEQNDGES